MVFSGFHTILSNILHLCVQGYIPSWIKPNTAKSLFAASQLRFKEWKKRLVVSEAWSCVRQWRTSGCCFCELSLPLNVTCSLYDISGPLLISCSATKAHSPLKILLAIYKFRTGIGIYIYLYVVRCELYVIFNIYYNIASGDWHLVTVWSN
jgi:hypothetical protein